MPLVGGGERGRGGEERAGSERGGDEDAAAPVLGPGVTGPIHAHLPRLAVPGCPRSAVDGTQMIENVLSQVYALFVPTARFDVAPG
jgi:hypothetical protein